MIIHVKFSFQSCAWWFCYPGRLYSAKFGVPTLSVIFSFLTVFLLHTAMMASFNKGQLPAQQTKVVDHGRGPLKAGPTHLCVPVCNHDAASSKPSSVGSDVDDIHQQTMCDCVMNV